MTRDRARVFVRVLKVIRARARTRAKDLFLIAVGVRGADLGLQFCPKLFVTVIGLMITIDSMDCHSIEW